MIRSTPLSRGAGPKRRTRLRGASDKTIAARPSKAAVRNEVFERDGWRCRMHGNHHECRGPLTVHHLRKSSDNGPYTPANLIALCAAANEVVEDYPIVSATVGLAERGMQTPEETWRKLHAAGLAASPEVGSAPWMPS